MAGARLVTASETESGATWSESLLKELTGNENPISARDPYGKPFSYRPMFKLTFVGNHAPKLKGRTPSMERRLRIVPFENEPAQPDPELKDKLRPEYPAILRWMLDGCVAWQQERLGTAKAIQEATSGYFEAQDIYQRWVDERCVKDGTLQERPNKIQADYAEYLRENGEPPISAGEFRELLTRTKGVKYVKVNGTPWVRGIGLKAPQKSRGAETASEQPGAGE
jgi:P4 family phage/plasmid primase-like protien